MKHFIASAAFVLMSYIATGMATDMVDECSSWSLKMSWWIGAFFFSVVMAICLLVCGAIATEESSRKSP